MDASIVGVGNSGAFGRGGERGRGCVEENAIDLEVKEEENAVWEG